ncbi:MAG: hypothetical protein CSB44_04085 [Gammaproteobacteria bacterium]|nr:MAG: hypothetical protein CSB44_04085 [Gammaproteobacteria bacterium]
MANDHLERLLAAEVDVMDAQVRVLARILDGNRHAEWFRVHDADGALSQLLDKAPAADDTIDLRWRYSFIDTYRKAVPLARYDDMAAAVARMLEGEPGVLTDERVLAFFQTSGTSATPKFIPVTTSLLREKVAVFASFWEQVYRDHPSVRDGVLVSNFIDAGGVSKSPAGVDIGSESGFWNRRGRSLASLSRWPLPAALRYIGDLDARLYAICRFLLQGKLHCLMSLNPSTLLQFCHTLEHHGEALLAGLESGTWGAAPDAILAALDSADARLLAQLVPAPDAAGRLAAAIAGGRPFRLRELWPELVLGICWQSPIVRPYLAPLAARFDGVPMRDYITQSSECMMAVPLADGGSGGMLACRSHFFEFIAEHDQAQPSPPTHLANALETGALYEPVVTTGGGLYRYRMGDALRVTGFRGSVPVLAFEYRFGRTASMSGEKLTEAQVLTAAERAIEATGYRPVEFLLCPASGERPHYALLLEGDVDTAVARAWCDVFHDALGRANAEYADKCASGRLGVPVPWHVASGVLAAARLERRAAGVSEAQVKGEVLVGTVDHHLGFAGARPFPGAARS